MAGALAMASAIEDFETQPRKRQRKDLPPVKTITNFYSPVPKPFSPPKTKILDYFSKTSPAGDKSSTSDQTKENGNKVPKVPGSSETLVKAQKPQRLKRGRRQGRPPSISTAVEVGLPETPSPVVAVSESSCSSDGVTVVAGTQGPGILGSETAALLAQISHSDCIMEGSPGKVDSALASTQPKKCSGESLKKRGSEEPRQDEGFGSPVQLQDKASPGDKRNKGRAAAKPGRKSKGGLLKQGSSETPEGDCSVCDTSLEGKEEEPDPLNSSTVVISFEDFLQSQNEQDGSTSVDPPDGKTEVVAAPCSPEIEPKPSQQVSPRTLTVQADVHPVSPVLSLPGSTDKKLASIFTRKRGSEGRESKPTGSPPPPLETSISPPGPLRRSNVVLPEDELELSVIESSSGSNCSQAERRQFMSAFRQAGLEGSRGKGRKVPGKQGEAGGGDAHPAEAERPEEGEQEQGRDKAPSPKVEQPKMAQKPGNKLRKSGRRRPREEAVAPVSAEAGVDSESSVAPEVGKEAHSAGADSTPTSTPAGRGSVRRSARAHPSSAPPALEQATPPPEPRSREGSKGQGVTEDCLAVAITPKTHKPKHSVYRAEMLSPPDDKGSPIRMRLRRIFPNSARKSGDASDFEIRTPSAARNPRESKDRKRAKKLVLKARELQQSRKTAVADPENKRMLRTRDVPKSYCEDEDSIVCLSDVQKSPAPDAKDEASGQKQLRSLNDVLGRNAAESKPAKSATGPKVAAMFLGKKPQRPAAVVSIFDDSSREGSENSQDDEHFKARREFLKSGLPESFKRQIARTTASRDAYALACASFQPVLHVLQRAADCPLWSLPWPVSPLLKHLNSTCLSPPRPLPSPGALDCVKTEPAVRAHADGGSGWRQDFSEDVRKRLLEEIRASNPAFPVRRFFTWFLKRREEHLLRPVSAEADKVTQTSSPADPPEACGKRKRRGEGEAVGKLPKRRRSARGEQEVVVITDDSPVGQTDPSAVVAPVGRARLRRARGGRMVQQGADVAEQTPGQNDAVIVLMDSPPPGNADQDSAKEDVLWTEKYQPQHSSEVIGNSAAVRRLRCWLEEWKQRADREERRSRGERSQGDCSNDSWDCGDFQGEGGLEDEEEAFCNTLLITGPPGVGKTAAVYACAQELGFKVFEVNASSQRSGRQILSQLREATQSHQVDIQGVNAHKPAYFNSHSAGSTRPGASPKKLNSPRKVVSSPRRPQNSPCRKRGPLAPTSLANFFKLGNKPKGRATSTETHLSLENAGPQKPAVTKKSVLKAREPPAKLSSDKKEPQTDEQSKKTATSLILFEEVDVIFDDDLGFLAAIKTFMTTTKRPVILTTNDPTFSAMFDGNFEEIHFKTPSEVNVRSYLQLLCLAENVRTEAQDVSALLCWNNCDVRRSLLHLQFWVRSGGRPGPPRPLPSLHPAEPAEGEAGPDDPVKPADEEEPLACSAPCDSGCAESLLGILNIDGTLGLSDTLKGHRCEELLVESWERGVDLLYSNMEELLPLPVCTRQTPLSSQQVALKPEPGSSAPPEDESPVKRSSRRRLALKDRDLFDSDSDDCFLSLPKLEKASNSKALSAGADGTEPAAAREEPPAGAGSRRQRKVDRSPEEQRSSELLSRCLDSLAEFIDHMSFLDSSVQHRRWQPEGACRPEAFGWTGAEVKSGLWDEARVEDGGGAGRESSAQIRAAVEGLSFRRCESSVSQVWAQAQDLRKDPGGESQLLNQLTLPVGPHRTALSLCQTGPCQPTVTQRRCEVMKTTLSSRAFSTLGNRSAAATDYLPFLRTVCRSERLKEQGKVKRRFLHYLDSIHLGLPKSTLQHLATEFP